MKSDQPAHPRSLISAFVICLLESIIARLATSLISVSLLVFEAKQAGLNLTLSEIPKASFSRRCPYLPVRESYFLIAYAKFQFLKLHPQLSPRKLLMG